MKPLLLASALLFISLFCFAQSKELSDATIDSMATARITARLEKYKKWVDKGLISADDYAAMKTHLLKSRRLLKPRTSLWEKEKGTSHYGFKVGTLMGLNDKSHTLNDQSAPQPSYTAGVFYEYDRAHFMFLTEVDVNGKSGNKNSYYFPLYDSPGYGDDDVLYYPGKTKVTRVNMEIPVLLGGRMGKWSVYGGPLMSTDVYALIKTTYNDGLGTSTTEDHTRLGLETDFMFGLGYSIPIKDKKKRDRDIVLDLRYANNMPGCDIFDRYATFTVGYKF